ncbi:MAG: hypothetical protein V4760_13010 [Bdellovibrionota bacterium]
MSASSRSRLNVLSLGLLIAAAAVVSRPGVSFAAADEAAAAAIKEFQEQPRPYMPIKVSKAEWDQNDEARFNEFVRAFGRAVERSPKRTLKSYMRDPSVNPYASTDPQGLVLYSDCADFPYFLRNYFAYKNGLPMQIAYGVQVNAQPYASSFVNEADLTKAKPESSPYGNNLTQRIASNIPVAPGRELNFVNYWSNMLGAVSTSTFRVGALTPNYDLSDVYPVKIDRNGIKPGTIVHSNGHILIVYDIEAKGTIRVVDAHPDNSLQVKIIEPATLDRSRPDHGFGFFNWRPLRAIGGQWIGGYLYNAAVRSASDRELFERGLFSLEQWFGPDSNIEPASSVRPDAWKAGFASIDFFDFLMMRLYSGSAPLQTDTVVGDYMVSLCEVLKQRTADIDSAIHAGMNRRAHPVELPDNVFSTTGEWEAYSTPSRDGRLRFAAADLPRQAITKFKQGTRRQYRFTFDGSAQDFQRSMLARLSLLNNTCKVTYAKSDGSRVTLTFTEMVRRLPSMSFDPYHCPERRWGASGSELASCIDGDTGGQWYALQQVMRNTVGKQDSNERLVIRSDRPITMDMMTDPRLIDQPSSAKVNVGASRSRVVDLESYFGSQQFLNDLSR